MIVTVLLSAQTASGSTQAVQSTSDTEVIEPVEIVKDYDLSE